ncbi:MAG TPA: response regulator [Trichocoleus sp.]
MELLAYKRILCIDNSKDDCELFGFVLAQAGYKVKSAQVAEAALQLIKAAQFDLCLASVSLFNGFGFSLIEKIRIASPRVPLIVCSADVRLVAWKQAIKAGAWAFFEKPIDFDRLLATVTRLLQ